MAKPGKELLKKISSVSGAVAALLSASNAAGSPSADPETAKRMQDAVDALKRASGADANQVRFHAGGQLDPQAQEILLAGHTSHSSHVSGSYIRGDGSGSDSSSSYVPSSPPTYTPSYYAPSSVPSSASTYTAPSTPASASTVNIAYRSGTHLAGSIIQKGSWGLQLLLKDSTRIQIPRRKLRAEDIQTLELPEPKATDAKDVPATVYLRLNDGTAYTGRVAAADGQKITLTADGNTSQSFAREQMDPETFMALQGLTPDIPPPIGPAPSPAAAASTAANPAAPTTPVAVGQQVLIKLKKGTKMLVTLLAKSSDEITFRTKDGQEYRLQASRLSAETLTALGMDAPAPEATPAPTPNRKKQA